MKKPATKKQLEKKRSREESAKKKVLLRRDELRKKKRYDRTLDEDVRATRPRLEPFVKPTKKGDDAIIAQLEHNLKILKALEDEYLKEQAIRKELHEVLESEGHDTLQEKMSAIAAKASEGVGESGQLDVTESAGQEQL